MNLMKNPKRPLTDKEKRKLEILESVGTVQEAHMDRIGPLTHIHAAGLFGQEDWIIVIQHCSNVPDLIYLAPMADFYLEAKGRGLSLVDADVFEEEV